MPNQAPFQTLADLLGGSSAKPVIESARFAPSTIYDLEYRIVVVACAFDLHSKTISEAVRRIQGIRLKLMQFIAVRPWLLPVVRDWAASRKEPQLHLLASRSLRRGFLGDEMHDKVIDYLVAHDALRRDNAFLVANSSSTFLSRLTVSVNKANLFVEERRVLQDLVKLRITNSMLEG